MSRPLCKLAIPSVLSDSTDSMVLKKEIRPSVNGLLRQMKKLTLAYLLVT